MEANIMDEILKSFPDLEDGWKEMEEKKNIEPAEREMLSLKYRERLEREMLKENSPEPEFTKTKRAEPVETLKSQVMTHYIDKDRIVAEIEKCYNECLKRAKITDSDYWNAKADTYRNVLEILNDTLEVKEVDFEKEMRAFAKMDLEPLRISDSNIGISITMAQLYKCARHFFKIGLKAQKGE